MRTAKITITFTDGRTRTVEYPDEKAEEILRLLTENKPEIIRDVESALNLEDAKLTKRYKITDEITAHLRVTKNTVRLTIEILGDYYTVYKEKRENFDPKKFEEIINKLLTDTTNFVFRLITENNTDVRIYGVYPTKYAGIFPNFIVEFNTHYSAGKPEHVPESIIALATSNAHLLVGVFRDELPHIQSGVLGSLVRKNQLLTDRELKLYLPNPRREETFLSGREKEALSEIERTANERIQKFNKLYGTNITIEDIAWRYV